MMRVGEIDLTEGSAKNLNLRSFRYAKQLLQEGRLAAEERALAKVGKEQYSRYLSNVSDKARVMPLYQYTAYSWEKYCPRSDKEFRTEYRFMRLLLVTLLFGKCESFSDFNASKPADLLKLYILLGMMHTQPWQALLVADMVHWANRCANGECGSDEN